MKNNKRIVICVSLIVIMICTLLVISNKPKKTFNYNGSTIALLVNGKVSNTFPSKGLYQIDITCDNADGVWDIDNWKLDIKNITGNVSCNVSFTSNPKLLSNVVNTTSTSGEVSGNGLLYKSDYGVRYKGNNTNNYIWYNKELYRIIGKTPVCTAVNTDGTCKTWNNNGLVKIIRNDSIGGLVENNYDELIFNNRNSLKIDGIDYTYLNSHGTLVINNPSDKITLPVLYAGGEKCQIDEEKSTIISPTSQFGSYIARYYFTNKDIEYIYIENIRINPYCNLRDKGLYDTDVKINFNGTATLNHQSIESGYEISKPGSYTLELKGKDDEKFDDDREEVIKKMNKL